MAQQVKPY